MALSKIQSESIDLADNFAGMRFGGTASDNALDDYEEGTFTPEIGGGTTAGSITYSVQQGRYTKVGRQVTLYIRIQYTAFSGSSGAIQIKGFPFATETGTSAHAISANWLTFSNGIPSGWPIFYGPAGSTHVNGLVSKDNAAWADWASSDFHLTGGNKYLNFNVTYQV